ncbi:MAG: four helix bundle protein [bacterium]
MGAKSLEQLDWSGNATAEQLARAVGSISANLAEGYSRSTRADRSQFLGCTSWFHSRKRRLVSRARRRNR